LIRSAKIWVCRTKQILQQIIKGKGKPVPLQDWSGPEGSRKLRFPDYMTTGHDGGKVVSPTHRPPLPSGKQQTITLRKLNIGALKNIIYLNNIYKF